VNEIDLVKAIHRAANNASDASKPVKVEVGTVVATSPIKIQISQNITLSKMQLIVPQRLTDYEVCVTVEWETEEETASHTHSVFGEDESGSAIDLESGEQSEPHKHEIKGRKTITIHNALAKGDSVILLRQDGGQKYVVLDKVVS